jgi:hypothetical protein
MDRRGLEPRINRLGGAAGNLSAAHSRPLSRQWQRAFLFVMVFLAEFKAVGETY